MTHSSEAETRLLDHTDRLVQGHRRLLADGERNRLFHEALAETVTAGSTVLDIGSGTGIWAVTAAMLGARRVVAIEYEPLLTGAIRAMAEENGVADRVEIISGDSRQVALGREFDVVISETIGHLVFDESIVSIMIDARERFLKPGGTLIPRTVRLIAAPASLESERLPVGIAPRATFFESLSMNIPIALTDRSMLKLFDEPRELVAADLMSADRMPDLTEMSATWEWTGTDEINCFAVWAEADLSESVRVTTYRTSSWMPMIYRIRPFAGGRGAVAFSLTLTERSNFWTANLTGSDHFEEQSYSPANAAADLIERGRPFSKVLDQLPSTPR